MEKSLEARIKEIRNNPQCLDTEMQVELAVHEHLMEYPHHQQIIEGSLPSLEEQAENFLKERFGRRHLFSRKPRYDAETKCDWLHKFDYESNILFKPIFLKRLYGGNVSKDIGSLAEFPEVKLETLWQGLKRQGFNAAYASVGGVFWHLVLGGLDFKEAATGLFAITFLLNGQDAMPLYESYLQTAKKADALLQEEVKPHLNRGNAPYR